MALGPNVGAETSGAGAEPKRSKVAPEELARVRLTRQVGEPRERSAAVERGAAGERVAAEHLERRGLTILDRNWRSGRRELDLVVREGEVVAFVEVKARGPGPQDPLEALGPAQRRDLRLAAAAWIRAHPGIGREFRFDVVGVRLRPEGPAEIEHVRNAFYGEEA